MARETRRQRRDQRKNSGGKPAAEAKPVASRARARQAQVRPNMQPASTQTGRRERRERGRFVKESWGELKKVEWPTQSHVIQGTLVVLIACAIVGTYIWIADIIFKNFVQNILLR